jgi:hypothetical protein
VAMIRPDRKGQEMRIAPPLTAARATGLLLAAVTAAASPAAAGMGSGGAYRASPEDIVSSSPSQCPCFVAGGPPGGLPAVLARRAARSREPGAGGVRVGSATATRQGESFDWADAGVGAAWRS